jgi:hypothetical protein
MIVGRSGGRPTTEDRMTRAKLAVALFAVVSTISFVAALIPVLKGDRMNVVFLGSGVVFLIVAIASAKKSRRVGDSPPAA